MDKKTARLTIRISPFDKNIIKAHSKELDISASEYLVRCGTKRKLPKPISEEELEAWKLLKGYQTNFQRISNLIKNRNPALDAEIQKIINELGKDLKYIRNGK